MPYCRDCAAWAELPVSAPATAPPPARCGQCHRHAPAPGSVAEARQATFRQGAGTAEMRLWPVTQEGDWCMEGLERT